MKHQAYLCLPCFINVLGRCCMNNGTTSSLDFGTEDVSTQIDSMLYLELLSCFMDSISAEHWWNKSLF